MRVVSVCFSTGAAGPASRCHDPQAGLEIDDGLLIGMLGAGQDVAGDTGAGQGLAEGTDVDVHPPTVTRSGLASGEVCTLSIATRGLLIAESILPMGHDDAGAPPAGPGSVPGRPSRWKDR